MAYLSLYRKYRPQFFADVVGQDHVVQTLQNALRSGRVANGYLFCGTRGVAKTTMARILAKGLNCVGPDGNAATPQPEPCNACVPCVAIAAGHAVDVVEMDAASNRSVNDIAKLRDSVQFGPMENRFKVYIVDEAHQLSSDAKDAFLKTLEEPPANVVFILATTETHAIPITIASRCQRFDFKRGSIGQIGQQIDRVLAKEDVSMHGDAIIQIARAADGSYRDALSLLDQVLAYKRSNITLDDVAEVLGTVKNDLLASAVQKIADSDFAGVFSISEEIFNQGKDVRQFLKTLSGRFRDMLFLSSGAHSQDDDQTLSDPVLRRQASQFSPSSLMDALSVLAEAERETRNSNQHRLLLEMALLKLTKLPTVPQQIDSVTQTAVQPVDQPNTDVKFTAAIPEVDDLSAIEPETSDDRDTLTIPMFGVDNEPAKLPPIPTAPAQRRPTPPPTVPIVQQSAGGLEASVPHELQYLRDHWGEAINHMQAKSRGGVPLMKDATPYSQAGQVITLEFTMSIMIDKMATNPQRLELVEDIINKTLKAPPKTFKVRPVLKGAHEQLPSARGHAEPPARPQTASKPTPVPDDSPSDLLDEVIAVFGGRIIEDDSYKR